MTTASFIVRPPHRGEAAEIHGLILELAQYEHLSHEVMATVEDTERALFDSPPAAEALLALEEGGSDVVGFALFYPFYSTFAGRPGLFLEDLYVRPPWRRRGAGRALLQAFLQTARERGCPKVEWRVLNWNEPAIRFYQSIGASLLSNWTPVRLTLSEGAVASTSHPTPAPVSEA